MLVSVVTECCICVAYLSCAKIWGTELAQVASRAVSCSSASPLSIYPALLHHLACPTTDKAFRHSRSSSFPESDAAASPQLYGPLANLDPIPSYEQAVHEVAGTGGVDRDVAAGGRRRSVALSARYPRVAVALGVSHVWYIPLLLCRGLSVTSAIWWACTTLFNIYKVCNVGPWHWPTSYQHEVDERAVCVTGGLYDRMLIAQIALSFVWVSQ